MDGKRRKKAAYKKGRNKASFYFVIGAIVILFGVVGWQSIKLNNKQKEYDAKEAYYRELIAEEDARSEELVEFEKYTKTDKYAEEVARQKFGLVKDGEIVFIAD